jgi:hypothetical protein
MEVPLPEHIPVPEDFQGFCPEYYDYSLAVGGYRRNLPHWRYEGATYFVTFRLHDSLPQAIARTMKEEASQWQKRLAAERLLLFRCEDKRFSWVGGANYGSARVSTASFATELIMRGSCVTSREIQHGRGSTQARRPCG